MKKAALIIILGVSVLLSAGSYFIYRTAISMHRTAIRTSLRSGNAVPGSVSLSLLPSELYVNSSDLLWEDDNEEVNYKGALYDIVSVSFQNGRVVLQLLSDQTEMDLRDAFASLSEESSASHSPLKLLKQFLSLKFLPDELPDFSFYGIPDESHFFSYVENFVSAFKLTETLPPV